MKKKEVEVIERRIPLKEALERVGVRSYNTWQSWLARGKIKLPLYKDGAKWFARVSDVEKIARGEDRLLYTNKELAERLGKTKGAAR